MPDLNQFQKKMLESKPVYRRMQLPAPDKRLDLEVELQTFKFHE